MIYTQERLRLEYEKEINLFDDIEKEYVSNNEVNYGLFEDICYRNLIMD